MPFTTFGSGSPAASSTVGARSMMCWNCVRISPFASIPLGQWITVALRVAAKFACPCPPTIGVQLAWPHPIA